MTKIESWICNAVSYTLGGLLEYFLQFPWYLVLLLFPIGYLMGQIVSEMLSKIEIKIKNE